MSWLFQMGLVVLYGTKTLDGEEDGLGVSHLSIPVGEKRESESLGHIHKGLHSPEG